MGNEQNQRLKEMALEIFEAGLDAVDPAQAVERAIAVDEQSLTFRAPDGTAVTFRRADFDHVVIVGAGKAGANMCGAAEAALGDLVAGGVVVTKYDHLGGRTSGPVEVLEAGHPVPDEPGRRGAQRVLDLVTPLTERTVLLSLISGGGSALLPLPAEGLSLPDKMQITSLLLAAGATIEEMNAVRKHLSAIKGGRLARAAWPAAVVSLILSDVVGDNLATIASGPTVADPTTFADALAVIDKYGLRGQTSSSVVERLQQGTAGNREETPKPGDPGLARSHNLLIGTNATCLDACERKARELGLSTVILSSTIEGETADVARSHAAIACKVRATGKPAAPPACIISGGETTVTLLSSTPPRLHASTPGKGGRNQEFALAAALAIEGEDKMALFSAGTDGTDGPTDAAGAIAFGDTTARAAALDLDAADFLSRHDSYNFFAPMEDLVMTGPTGTNVMDVRLIIVL